MTRIDPPGQVAPVNKEEMKQIVRRELFIEIFRRKLLGCLGTLLVLLLVTLVPATFVASMVAKSGFVRVPILSAWLYEPGAPLRVVRPYEGTTTEDVMRSVGRSAAFNIRTGLATITVKETELTTIVAEAAANSGMRSAQAVIEPRSIELFAVIPQGEGETTILARLTPVVTKGKLSFDVTELHLGSLAIAPSLAQIGATYLTSIVSDALARELSSAGNILDVSATPGELVITLVPAGTR